MSRTNILTSTSNPVMTGRASWRLVVGTPMAHQYLEQALAAKSEGGGGAAYDEIVVAMGEDTDEETSKKTLAELTLCTSLLQFLPHQSLVHAVLTRGRWESALFGEGLSSFILNATANHVDFLAPCLKHLIKCLCVPGEGDAAKDLSDQAKDRVHSTLAQVIRQFPTGTGCLLQILLDAFPHKRYAAHIHTTYLAHALRILDYAPSLSEQFFFALVDHLLQMDVEIKLEDLPDDDDELCFNLEMPHAAQALQAEQVEYASKLDVLMNMSLEHSTRRMQASLDSAAEHFGILWAAFERLVLPTYQSKCVQFFLFHAASFDPKLAQRFASCLLHALFDTARSEATRISAACYIGSFLARAKYLTPETRKVALTLLVQWLHTYVSLQNQMVIAADIALHRVFYSCCQNLFYSCVYALNNSLKPDDRDFYLGLRLDELLTCHLRPLEFVYRGIAVEFSRSALLYDLLPSEAARAAAAQIQVMPMDAQAQAESTFFPFDPYVLKLSSAHIDPLYRVWRQAGQDDSINGGCGGGEGGAAGGGHNDEEDLSFQGRTGSSAGSSVSGFRRRIPSLLMGSNDSRCSPMARSLDSMHLSGASLRFGGAGLLDMMSMTPDDRQMIDYRRRESGAGLGMMGLY